MHGGFENDRPISPTLEDLAWIDDAASYDARERFKSTIVQLAYFAEDPFFRRCVELLTEFKPPQYAQVMLTLISLSKQSAPQLGLPPALRRGGEDLTDG